ncbi:hypothetical protein [Peptostreptococcus porci]|uniref:hypothetical protein n=1 Tax=Peptostreptococcus porci TaxID=2652282 RepID=UPI002A8FE0B0|nr:hypothetical protein [Peptostreptococcus porci]MDY4561379.1 hypothetical protein [Peptostreptococcus porci]MDY5437149.1 hypothetical protein [Peptostreptococcus porci]
MELNYSLQTAAVRYAIMYLEGQINDIERDLSILKNDGYKIQLAGIKRMYEDQLSQLKKWYESEE